MRAFTMLISFRRSQQWNLLPWVTYVTVAFACIMWKEEEETMREECNNKLFARSVVSYEKGQMHSSMRDHFMTKFASLDANFFRAMFRMSRFAYETLRTMLGPFLVSRVPAKNLQARKGTNRQPLSIYEIICIGLRILGGAAYVDAAWGFKLSISSVYFSFF
jgi:hypothetical protein